MFKVIDVVMVSLLLLLFLNIFHTIFSVDIDVLSR